jgi:peptidoglycan/LPS O-acetylase OafA/YrhL
MKLYSIQFLRAVAAILVVYVHAIDLQMVYSHSFQQDFLYLQNFGAIGVDIFFAISGFIITYVAGKYTGMNAGLNFLVKRFIRINPIYYIASFAFLLLHSCQFWFAGFQPPTDEVLNNTADTLLVLPMGGKYAPLLSVGWTLAFEWFFYIVFFFGILFKAPNKIAWLATTITALVILGKTVSLPVYQYLFITNPIMLEFVMGVLICWIYLHVEVNTWVAYALLFFGLAGFAYSVCFGYGTISELGDIMWGRLSLWRVIQWGIPSAALVAGAIFLEKQGQLTKLWSNRWCRLLGDASYSIYLTHVCAIEIFILVYGRTGFFLNPDFGIWFHLAISVALGTLVYLKVEKPLLAYLNKTYMPTRGAVPAVV